MKTSMFVRLVLVGVMLTSAISCQSVSPTAGKNSARVTHIVICWLKNPGDSAARKELIETSQTFQNIPGMVSVSAGECVPSDRLVVDSSYDVAIIMTFKDEKSLRDFDTNPIHQAARKDHLQPLVKKFVIYDFVER